LIYKQYQYLLSKSVSISISSPWTVLSANFFILYGLSTFLLLVILFFSKKKYITLLISLHYLFSFGIIILIYKLGFGYDPYLHQASEKLIFQTGTFSPKPFYYLGQYSLVVILSKIFAQSIEFFDRLLVPLMAAIFLPIVIFQSIKDNLDIKNNIIAIATFLFLLIPFANFTYTTPQSLANIFALIIVFLSVSFINYHLDNFWPLILLSIATCFIHPLSGLPILLFVFLTWFFHKVRGKNLILGLIKSIFFWGMAFLSCFILPLAFWFYNLLYKLDFSKIDQITNNNLLISLAPNNIFWPKYINIFDLVYLYYHNVNLIIVIVALLGLFFVIYHHRFKNYFTYLLMFLILIVNYLIVINYTQFPFLAVFSERIFNLSFYFLLPFFIVALVAFLDGILKYRHIFKPLIFIFLSIFLGISLYLSYPRVDKYENFHGYSMSDSHLKAVEYIEENFSNFDYIVLSDQTLGATVIKEYGFKKYYQGEFYYSLPTKIKDNIYTDFLEMTKEETNKKESASQAAQKTGVNMVFVVLNDYWDLTEKLITEHQDEANNWVEVDGGKAFIFQYLVNMNHESRITNYGQKEKW
ncbi:hypothetical protein K8R66_03520, partial [bacterium]|nr:hypothetical protein [bacterium]